jgi:hypothetical protein
MAAYFLVFALLSIHWREAASRSSLECAKADSLMALVSDYSSDDEVDAPHMLIWNF